ncbi:aminotransferase class I/II-fold pyridoxal phosphate-dependent enzyme [Tenuibacillus multivorans]|uniref:Lysine decarboxylase n=1 Tax=Tenuibacillus multivorans TaxID=237069 RepID=A0A1G9W2S0_9BACI|nr:aminotransferase class I/II-fold pyridoxal phosphate-dependent enzyme [Tenuibacillus multivorans]GEL78282.1 lysine decarboxylase [Tenuibacillus multivorans]SDM78491.1 lysine decarboxylase [Tenuibacillus multivorans]
MDQSHAPLYEMLTQHVKQQPKSYHVPGHKNGAVFPTEGDVFSHILRYDLTELPGLDDLHQPEGAILEAERLAAAFYKTDYTFFLVNGSTVGNLAMILSVCQPGDTIIVQRNSHKSIMNGLELAGAKPIFVSPSYDERTERYSDLKPSNVKKAIEANPEAKAVMLTHPDYFGTTYDLSRIVEMAHQHNIPVLVDEAHGAHFPLSNQFPDSTLKAGADLVVHSAHKTLPAMTMGSYLHIQGSLVTYETLKHYLQMLQSSSPSYPIMASLDLARKYIAGLNEQDIESTLSGVRQLRHQLNTLPDIDVMPIQEQVDDPLKITLTSRRLYMRAVEQLMQDQQVFPEMIQNNQLLLIYGLQAEQSPLNWVTTLKDSLTHLYNQSKHDTIAINKFQFNDVQGLAYDYHILKGMPTQWVRWQDAEGQIAASSVIPYPPGIPILLKGERIQAEQIRYIEQAIQNHQYIQYNGKDIEQGIEIFIE